MCVCVYAVVSTSDVLVAAVTHTVPAATYRRVAVAALL